MPSLSCIGSVAWQADLRISWDGHFEKDTHDFEAFVGSIGRSNSSSGIKMAAGLTRRRFVQNLIGAGSVVAFGWDKYARAASWGEMPVLSGRAVDLVIAPMAINVTGRRRIATAVNGSVPAPVLRFRQGDVVTLRVANRLTEPTSIHWHGVRLPNAMDGVPGLTFAGIMPGEAFTYRFPIVQAGTYWYHSHSGLQEQTGVYGPLIFEPQKPEHYEYEREHILVLSDWTDEDPMTVISNLKQQSDYYNFHRRTAGTFIRDVERQGLGATVKDRMMWGRMRMSPTDIMDVTGATYTFLINGRPPGANWTGLFRRGERIRLRFINSSAMTTFDVRVPGLPLVVVQADGSDVRPVEVDEFRIGVAETFDVIVAPRDAEAYTIFAQPEDRSGYACATLAIREGLRAPVPALDPRPQRSMADMGGGMAMASPKMAMPMPPMAGQTAMGAMPGMALHESALPTRNADGVDPTKLRGQPWVDNVALRSKQRYGESGDGLEGNGRRVLTYAQLEALESSQFDHAPPTREIEFHLTGNMQRWVWGFDGKKFSEAAPTEVALGERIRFVFINDTMMEHPIHLHGFLFELENGQQRPPLKHTVNVKPGERIGVVYTADTPGAWALHCHLLYHMETGMFRTVRVA